MKSSCISHPANQRLLIIRCWQRKACNNNLCAAALLSFFEYWHNWKTSTDNHHHKINNISQKHGYSRLANEDNLQFHTSEELKEGLLGLYSRPAINVALKLLQEKGFISIHRNPNPRFKFDNTKFFKFYPHLCQMFINEEILGHKYEDKLLNTNIQAVCQSASTEVVRGELKNLTENLHHLLEVADDSHVPAIPPTQTDRTIPKIYNKAINQYINKEDETNLDRLKSLSPQASSKLRNLILSLQHKGLSASKFYPDCCQALAEFQNAGISDETILQAFDRAVKVTAGKKFGVNYLIEVVKTINPHSPLKNKKSNKLGLVPPSYSSKDFVTDASAAPWLLSKTEG